MLPSTCWHESETQLAASRAKRARQNKLAPSRRRRCDQSSYLPATKATIVSAKKTYFGVDRLRLKRGYYATSLSEQSFAGQQAIPYSTSTKSPPPKIVTFFCERTKVFSRNFANNQPSSCYINTNISFGNLSGKINCNVSAKNLQRNLPSVKGGHSKLGARPSPPNAIRSSLCLFLFLNLALQNAVDCQNSGFVEHNNNNNLVDYNIVSTSSVVATDKKRIPPTAVCVRAKNANIHQTWVYNPKQKLTVYQPPSLNSNYLNDDNRRRFARQTNDDLMHPFGSFLQDPQPAPQPNGPQVANSWTSILTNPFGLPSTATNVAQNDSLNVHIDNILVPRVSGTPGNIQVRQYIVDVLKENNYQVELDEFVGSTPIGNVQFANIIGSSDPAACRQLVLACHYDSKMMDGFLGATDSAVPCAMLLKLAENFSRSFRPPASQQPQPDGTAGGRLGLRFVFFDGEEAFVQWTKTDSLYGSRHLAAKWAKQQAPSECRSAANKNELSRIELFVLLDLIGASDSSFVMYSSRLKHHYDSLQKHERAYLAKLGFDSRRAARELAFKGRQMPLEFVEDDHVPFKQRNVPILLLLAHPFPRVWHTVEDNYEAIDFARTRRILHSIEQFVATYKRAP